MVSSERNGRALLATGLAVGLILSACGGGGSGDGEETVVLRLSHQWPATQDGEGDYRAVVAQRFAEQVNEESDGSIEVEVFPNSSLVGTNEQYDAMLNGSLDMSVFPLSYAAGRVPAFDITLMPTLVPNHEVAQAWQEAGIGQAIDDMVEENGAKILTWMWSAGIFATKGEPIITPDDIAPGMVMRGAGSSTEEVLEAAGAGITSLPSNEIYTALQTGVLDGVTTSPSSVMSFNLQEQIDAYTASTQNSMWFIMNPLIISIDTWNGLSPEQQEIVEGVGADLQEYAYEGAVADEERATGEVEAAGVEVVEMDDTAFAEWRSLSEQTAWASFAEDVPNGQELLDLAQEAAGQ